MQNTPHIRLSAVTTRGAIDNVLEFVTQSPHEVRTATADDSTVVGIVQTLFVEALRDHASDIHIEPMRDRLRVRCRCDGVLVQYKDLPIELAPAISSRIKILAKADIAEKCRHQDGRMLFEDPHNGLTIDMRASFYVTIHGEKIVLRLLNKKGELLDIEEIGMAPRMLERFRDDALDVPSGVLIITGPTGSGKTTTLYSCVNHLNDMQTSIITAEDPVEYVIDGIAQCSINPKINVTFSDTLRGVTFKLGRGCRVCRFTGYRGRVGIFELLILNEMVKDAILNRQTSYEIRRISLETSGLVTLIEDGLVKAAKGATSIPEILRHLPRLHKPRPIQQLQRLLGELR